MTTGHRRDIDGLRSIAVLPVVFEHAGISGFPGGFVGVDIFFVISGYLITRILLKDIAAQRFSIVTFYERRARRILPALFALLAICLIGGWFVLLPDAYVRLAQSAIATLTFLSNVWFWRQTGNYFAPAADMEPLLHTWSLAVEEQFYIIFPLFLWLIARDRRRRYLFWGLLIPCLASFGLSVWATRVEPIANFFLAPTRAWELGIGAFLAAGRFPDIRRPAAIEALAWIGCGLIVASILVLSPSTPFPGLAALPACLGTALILWSGERGSATALGRLLSLPGPVWIGLISYSLYLWHWPVLVALRLYHGALDLPLQDALFGIALAILLAHISWRLVETPFRRRGTAGYTRRGIFGLSAAGGVALTALAGLILVGKGFESRVPPDAMATYDRAVQSSPLEDRCYDRRAEGFCRLGAEIDPEAPVDLLIWGDSHAGVMLPGIEDWLKATSRTAFAAIKPGCPPMLGIVRADLGADGDCDRFNTGVAEFLASRPDVGTVILAARWALAVEGTLPEGEPGGDAVLELSNPTAAAQAPQGNAEIAAFGLSETLAMLQRHGRQALILEGVPEVGFSVPRALLNAGLLSTRLAEPPGPEAFDNRNQRANAMIATLAEQYGARHVSLARAMCDGSTCRIADKEGPLYRDDDHLSVHGARIILPPLLARAFGD